MGEISRQTDMVHVRLGWWDGGGKRKRQPIAQRKNKSRSETMYLLGFNAGLERKSYAQTMDAYRELLQQEREDAKKEAAIKAEETDKATEEVIEAEGMDAVNEQVMEDEGEDTSQQELESIEEGDPDQEMEMLDEEDEV
ncbi:MAG: hypothetical protein ACF8OB_12975 [Phycisphaeraceae bacterium JB051]